MEHKSNFSIKPTKRCKNEAFKSIYMLINEKNSYISRFLLFLILCSSISFIQAQDTTGTINSIVIIGNEITGENVIRRELLLKVGDIPKPELLEESKKRLMNLLLFNRVEMNLYPQNDGGLILLIEITERLYFYPVPILTLNERDWSKWSYGLSVVNVNFRGQNERIWGGIWFGYRPGFGIRYSDQWAGDSLHLNTGLSVMKTIFNHRTIAGLEEKHVYGSIVLGKWWGYHFNTAVAFNYDHIKVAEEFADLMLSGNSSEQTFGIEFSIRHDTRDLFAYPSSGWLNQFKIFKFGFFESYNHYTNLVIDLRGYKKIGPIIFAGRFLQNSLFGAIPVYRMNYLGFSERVRGYFNEVREGKHLQIGSLETRFNIIPIRYFSMNLPPIPPQYLRNLKIGLSGAFFVDTGIVWNESTEFHKDNYLTGFGFGLHLHLPYVEIFRFDIGFNHEFRAQFIFEVGVVF